MKKAFNKIKPVVLALVIGLGTVAAFVIIVIIAESSRPIRPLNEIKADYKISSFEKEVVDEVSGEFMCMTQYSNIFDDDKIVLKKYSTFLYMTHPYASNDATILRYHMIEESLKLFKDIIDPDQISNRSEKYFVRWDNFFQFCANNDLTNAERFILENTNSISNYLSLSEVEKYAVRLYVIHHYVQSAIYNLTEYENMDNLKQNTNVAYKHLHPYIYNYKFVEDNPFTSKMKPELVQLKNVFAIMPLHTFETHMRFLYMSSEVSKGIHGNIPERAAAIDNLYSIYTNAISGCVTENMLLANAHHFRIANQYYKTLYYYFKNKPIECFNEYLILRELTIEGNKDSRDAAKYLVNEKYLAKVLQYLGPQIKRKGLSLIW